MRDNRWLAFTGLLLVAACSPYVYSDQIAKLGDKFSEAQASYERGQSDLLAESHASQVARWANERPSLRLTQGCDIRQKSACAVYIPSDYLETGGRPPVVVRNPEPDDSKPEKKEDACKVAGAPISNPEAVAKATDKSRPLTREAVFKTYLKYFDGLKAVANSADRTAFDAAAAKLATSAGTLATTAGVAAGGVGAAAGPVVSGAVSTVLWFVGEALDYRRYEALRDATKEACHPVRDLAKALILVLEEQQGSRITELNGLVTARFDKLNLPRSRKSLSDDAYVQAASSMFEAIDQYDKVRAVEPDDLVNAVVVSHDALVLAIHKGDGQFSALIQSLDGLAANVDKLVAATRRQPKG